MADRYWVTGGTTTAWTDTSNWSATSNGTRGASAPTTADNAFFDRPSTYTVSGSAQCLNLSVTAGSVTFNLSGLTCYGTSFSLGIGNVVSPFTATSVVLAAAASTTLVVTTNGVTIAATSTFNFGVLGRTGTVQLGSSLTATGGANTVNLQYGTVDINNFVLAAPCFTVVNATSHTILFGTGYINVTGLAAGSVLWDSGASTLTTSGNQLVRVSYSGANAVTLSTGASAGTEANSLSFEITGGTYQLSTLTGNTCRSLNFNAGTFAGTWMRSGLALTMYGSLTLSSQTGFSVQAASDILTFAGTNASNTITSNSKTIDCPIVFNGVGASWALQDALLIGSTRSVTLTNGTININNKSLTAGSFSSANANIRTVAFGTSGTITCNSTAGGTLWTTATITNLTITGTPVVNISNSGAVATSVLPGVLPEANSISFNFTTGTYALTFLGTASYAAKNVDFTGFAGTWAATAANFIYGSLTLSTGMTLTASTGVMRFSASSGTQIITSNAKTMDFPVNVQGTGSGVVQLADALTLGATRVLSLQTGTFDGTNKTISGASSINISTTSCGAYTVKNISTALAWNTGTSSVVTLGGPCTFGAVAMTSSPISLDLVSYQLTCTSFTSGNGTRTLAFGTGNITVNGAGGTLINFTSIGTMTITGTPVINVSYSGATAVTIVGSGFSEAQSISYNFTAGTYSLTFLNTSGDSAKNIDFSGFGGTWAAHSTGTIYGNLTMSAVAGFSATANTSALTFGATSGTQIITSNAKTHDYPITLNGVGGTVQLADALLMGTTRILAHTNGTLDLNGKTLTVGTQYQTVAGTQVLTFNGGTLTCPGVTTLAFNNAAPAGFSTVAGTGTGKISMTGATAKTFVGGGSTYNCTLSNDGAGALTISGANTFTTIANGVQPTAFVFPISVTQTVTNWNVSGTAGNLVTITSGTAGTAATLSKSSGTVSSNYLSLKDSAATGGATWYAGANSTNVSGNSGWIFSNAPSNATGSFFFMF